MKWKERLLLLVFTIIVLILVIIRKNSIDNSLLASINVRSLQDNISLFSIPFANWGSEISEEYDETWMSMHPWDMWQDMVTDRAITQKSERKIMRLLKEIVIAKVVSADVGYKGTQLKARITLAGPEKQLAVFKPQRYERSRVLDGTPYEGYDRHNAEIAAFQLDRILGFYRAPPAVGRILNLETEVLPVARKKLAKTFFKDKDGNTCFYGVCLYCKKEEPACAEDTMLEGAVILWIPHKWEIAKMRHPWQRTYSKRKARWEEDDNYCDQVIKKPPYNEGPRLLDIMDAAIFDFLIGNADRHHYEYLAKNGGHGMLLLMDNGKSFGNPFKDETSILAPIYQCCQLRRSTYQKILSFSTDSTNSSSLSQLLEKRLEKDPLHPILTSDHLLAIDRRLKRILTMISMCFDRDGEENVLK